jgi:hypothetical protein
LVSDPIKKKKSLKAGNHFLAVLLTWQEESSLIPSKRRSRQAGSIGSSRVRTVE